MHDSIEEFIPLGFAVLTVSDTRGEAEDTSGRYLRDALSEAGHLERGYGIVKDDIINIQDTLTPWLADAEIKVIIITGGTGIYLRDITPEAVRPLLDMEIPGFGELFRALSFDEIGASTIQSRSFAGIARRTLIFCVPGSTGACRTAWEKIIGSQIDSRHRPCNFIKAITESE